MKAFLCHSSADKEYVRTIAKRLTRARVVFDEMCFPPGEDFRKAIADGLDASSLFAFVVSRRSLQSVWCQYELDEAEERRMRGAIAGGLAIIIDNGVTTDDLPRWLRGRRAIFQRRPVLAAREIQAALISILTQELRNPFLGRGRALEEFATSLLREPDGASSRVFSIHGLDGVGRRTFLARSLQDTLSLRLGPVFAVDATRALDDLYLWLFDETSEQESRSNLAAELPRFRQLPQPCQVAELAAMIKVLCENGFVPCIVDRGGVLTEEKGQYREPYAALIDALMAHDDAYIAFIHRRQPDVSSLAGSAGVTDFPVRPLDRDAMRLLVKQLLKSQGVVPSSAEISELVEFLDGYPPAAYMAAGYAKRYGFTNLLANKIYLEDFKARAFATLIEALKLSAGCWRILQYLAGEQSVPLPVICAATDLKANEAAPLLKELIDLSLVVVADETFAMSGPIRTAVFRAKGGLSAEEYARVADALRAQLWGGDRQQAPTIQVVDATLHALLRGGNRDLGPYADLVRPSTLHQMARESYDRHEWVLARDYAERTLAMDPRRADAQVIRFKALVRLEEWAEAEEALVTLEREGEKKRFYLRGFYYWKRHQFERAAGWFRSALEANDRANAVYRDYAEVLYRLGRFEHARKMIETVRSRDPGNVYVLDLITRISIDGKQWPEATRALEALERADTERRFIHHRKSRYYSARGMLDLARAEADRAAASAATFEALAQRADVLIQQREFGLADAALEEIRRHHGRARSDVQNGLRCKLLARQGRWREARAVWDELVETDKPVHRALLRQILSLKAGDETLDADERQTARREAEALQAELEEAEPQLAEEGEWPVADTEGV